MNIYSGNSGSGSGYNGTVMTGNPAFTPTPGGVNIDSGDPINVNLSYQNPTATDGDDDQYGHQRRSLRGSGGGSAFKAR